MIAPAPKTEAWTYASGRVAALEGGLLGREALERLAGADSASAAAAALAESPLRAVAAGATTAAGAAEALAGHYSGALQSLRADCPHPALFELVALPARFRGLKERVRAALAEPGGTEAGPEAAREMLGDFAPRSEAAVGLNLLLAALAGEGPPEAALAVDLALDSARLLEAARLAEILGNDAVRGHVAAETGVRSTLLVWRTRLVAPPGGDAPSGKWLPRLFLRGRLARSLAGRLWAAEPAAWSQTLAAELSPELGGEVFGAGEEARLNAWERAAFNWLTARAREFRGAAFGVDRVYGYGWGLAVEERNVRLALVGRLRGVDPGAIKALLWEPYV